MRKFSHLLLIVIGTMMFSACGEKFDRSALATEIAAEIYATQTASAPTITPTPPATSTSEALPTPTLTPFIPPEASVRSDMINVREGPATEFDSEVQLPRGTYFEVTGQYNRCSWLKIRAANGQTGWVKGGPDYVALDVECISIPHAAFRPKNGMFILDKRARSGSGELRVNNTTTQDAVIVIADIRNSPYIAAYIHAGEVVLLQKIPADKYPLYFFNGEDWDGDERAFMKPGYQKRVIDLLDYLKDSQYIIDLQVEADDISKAYDVTGTFPSLKQ